MICTVPVRKKTHLWEQVLSHRCAGMHICCRVAARLHSQVLGCRLLSLYWRAAQKRGAVQRVSPMIQYAAGAVKVLFSGVFRVDSQYRPAGDPRHLGIPHSGRRWYNKSRCCPWGSCHGKDSHSLRNCRFWDSLRQKDSFPRSHKSRCPNHYAHPYHVLLRQRQ